MNITIKTIPHDQHRYPTVGDWWFTPEGDLEIRVSAMGDWRHEALVAVHELAEVLLCKERGITEEAVTQFDIMFEANRQPGDDSEAGDDPRAPYRWEHFFATNVERLLADQLNVDWQEYDEKVGSL